MIKPEMLKPGDKVAVVSLSSGLLGEEALIHKYEIAKEYYESGKYLWNSGMFIFKYDTIMDALKKYGPIKGVHRYSYKPVAKVELQEMNLFEL